MQRSGNSYKVRLALSQLESRTQLIEIDILKGETRTPDFLAKNPNGRVPLLEVAPGRHLAESNAILCISGDGSRLLSADPIRPRRDAAMDVLRAARVDPNLGSARFWLTHGPGRPRPAEPCLRGLDGEGLSRARRDGEAPGADRFSSTTATDRRHRALRLYATLRTRATTISPRSRRSVPGSSASPPSPATSPWTSAPETMAIAE